jgi:uncharacterized protein
MPEKATAPQARFGVGLRPVHFPRLLERPRTAVGWLEAISENYMDTEGRPLQVLASLRRDFPVALHGVSLSVGGVEGPRPGYLERLKRLADRVDPWIVTDHLCFTGAHASNAHDLLPLPYTEEALRVVVSNLHRTQEALGRRVALENVSSYLSYADSEMSEWEFLVEAARRSGCGILLDVNNIFVSAANHGFRAETYLESIPPELVVQMHLGGYTDMGDFLFDTHSRAPTEPVWELYRRAAARFPGAPVLVEWDEGVPGWDELESQAVKAARIWGEANAVEA